ncbi:unnamed protein product [Litomosoides sigmodontis]|uniref:G-protein coupled receptors family 1 profile domain-containing protein n=1 Tax=Litomosoides sigmodontis TaxID=42156 RepID=A0A3P6U9C4_LITSI|nr:unnamed protein product [Litomosoides sigmodontis]
MIVRAFASECEFQMGQILGENVSATAIKEKVLPLFANYILCTYGYVIIGVLLMAINIPTSLIMFTHAALRNSYMVLAVVFLNNGFLGVSAAIVGVKRLIDTRNGQRLQSAYSIEFYEALLLLTSVASMLSIIVMFIALFILRKNFGAQFLSKNSQNRNLSRFLKNQKEYTQTAMISCCFTFLLVVVSSTVECIFETGPSVTSQSIVMFCVYLRLLNSFNMAISFLYRQKDFQLTAIRCFKYLFRRRKQNVEPLPVADFAR